MNGGATFSSPFAQIYEPGVAEANLSNNGNAQVSDGIHGVALDGIEQSATLTFNNPINAFGAYWGAADIVTTPALVSLTFYDDNDNLIATDSFNYAKPGTGELDWHGWQSSVSVKKITYSGDFVTADGFQANNNTNHSIPEPGTLALVTLAGLLGTGVSLARRKNNRRS